MKTAIATGILGLVLTAAVANAQTATEQARILRDFDKSVVEYSRQHKSLDLFPEALTPATPAPKIFTLPVAMVFRQVIAQALAEHSDGTAIGMVSQAAALRQALSEPGIEFDTRKLGWIGRIAPAVEITLAMKKHGVVTLEDARKKELIIAATAAGSTTEILPRLMNIIGGTKFRIVKGYQGASGGSLAMERGETQGTHETEIGRAHV